MQQSTAKDVFLHLFSIIGLYISVGAFITLIFQYINVWFPDRLDYYSLQGVYSTIRWSLASLIIVFPLYILSVWVLERGYRDNPATLSLRIRKWLIYFTLFAAAVIIAGDLVALVYNLLNGDLTVRFLLKVATVLVVSGSVFGYYFVDIRKTTNS